MNKRYLPVLMLAAGTLGGTLISVLTWANPWLVMAGPLVLAGGTVAARLVERRFSEGSGSNVGVALVLAVIFLVTGAIMALRDPSQVPFAVAVRGGNAVLGLGQPRGGARAAAPRPGTGRLTRDRSAAAAAGDEPMTWPAGRSVTRCARPSSTGWEGRTGTRPS